MTPSQILAFYDGHCGLCHMAVVFLLKRDRSKSLCFAPTQSRKYREFAQSRRVSLTPRSIIVWNAESQKFLVESDAVLHLMASCGSFWRNLAIVLSVLPKPLRDGTYRLIARIRHRLFRRPGALVPLVPHALRGRIFEDSDQQPGT